MILLDTNVLVYAVASDAAAHPVCRDVVERAMSGALEAVLVPQVLVEFYAVVTSPRRVRSPMSPREAMAQVADWRRTMPVRHPTARCLDELDALVTRRRRVGQEVHDLFLAAQMRTHGVEEICTLNGEDFAGIAGIRARGPAEV